MQGRIVVEAFTMGTDTGTTSQMDADGDNCTVDVGDKTHISVFVNQLVDDGNATLLIEKTIDGTNWATVATKSQADFPAGANKSFEVSLSDSNGMPLRAKQLRVSLSGHSGTGAYTATVVGSQVAGYR